MLKRDVIVTGIPRSGTTLIAALINSLENSVCIGEPESVNQMIGDSTSPMEYVERIETEYSRLRRVIMDTRRIQNRVGLTDEPLTNYVRRTESGSSEDAFRIADVEVKIAGDNFSLAIKHNANFLCILPELCRCDRFSVIAVIRNPISTILSWRSVKYPISIGRLPAAEKFWPIIREIGASDDDVLVKQVKIYEQIGRRVIELRDQLTLIRYEALVDRSSLIEDVFRQKAVTDVLIEKVNRRAHYDYQYVGKIVDAIEKYSPSTLELYPGCLEGYIAE